MSNTPGNNQSEASPSMEQILQTIRGVITEDNPAPIDDGVLELTEMVEEGTKDVLQLNQPIHVPPTVSQGNDILKDIDNIFKESIPVDSQEPKISAKVSDKLDEQITESVQTVTTETIIKEQPVTESISKIEQSTNIVKETNITDKQDVQPSTNERLLSEASAIATSEALKTLVKTVSKPNTDGLGFRSGSTVEDLINEMIKPYLKEWLDKNLPSIVKHLVEKEIQKLIPKED
jgi:cell pole-organizing protein PopZ